MHTLFYFLKGSLPLNSAAIHKITLKTFNPFFTLPLPLIEMHGGASETPNPHDLLTHQPGQTTHEAFFALPASTPALIHNSPHP